MREPHSWGRHAAELREIRADDERRARNRKKAPDSDALAQSLFDLFRTLHIAKLETLAIRVDALAQEGRNVTQAETEAILDEAMEAANDPSS